MRLLSIALCVLALCVLVGCQALGQAFGGTAAAVAALEADVQARLLELEARQAAANAQIRAATEAYAAGALSPGQFAEAQAAATAESLDAVEDLIGGLTSQVQSLTAALRTDLEQAQSGPALPTTGNALLDLALGLITTVGTSVVATNKLRDHRRLARGEPTGATKITAG